MKSIMSRLVELEQQAQVEDLGVIPLYVRWASDPMPSDPSPDDNVPWPDKVPRQIVFRVVGNKPKVKPVSELDKLKAQLKDLENDRS